jgi:hypothetical protein
MAKKVGGNLSATEIGLECDVPHAKYLSSNTASSSWRWSPERVTKRRSPTKGNGFLLGETHGEEE